MVVQERQETGTQEPGGVSPLDEATIQFLADRIRMDGYAVLEDVIPLELIGRLRQRFDELLDARIRADASNRGANRYQMFLPWEPPFTDPLVYENPRVMPLLERVMGQDLIMTYLASDTPLPGSDYQRVHSDTRLLFPETQLSLPAYGIVANFPLVDVTEENGPLELWPGGTHLFPVRPEMERLAPTMQSVRLTLRAGSVLLRDLRCWHRGTPNRGTRSRPHVALVYTARGTVSSSVRSRSLAPTTTSSPSPRAACSASTPSSGRKGKHRSTTEFAMALRATLDE